MNIQDLESSLDYLFAAEVTAFIWGHAGIGKTSILRQYALKKQYKFFPFYLGTQSDVGDILGLASFVKDKNGSEVATTFATPLWLKETIDYCAENPDSGAIIFLDEFNRARRDILNGMFSLALDKSFHTLKLPKNCHVIAAGNPPTDEYNVTDVDDTALMARFAHIKLEPTFDEWLTYAKDSQFEPSLISFLKEQPELLEDRKSTFLLPIKVDRRAYERVNRLFKVNTPQYLLKQLMQGIIGTERTLAYELHLKSADRPLSGLEILNGTGFDKLRTWTHPDDVKSSLITHTCDAVIEEIKTNGLLGEECRGNFMEFLRLLPSEAAYVTLKKLHETQTPSFLEFIRTPAYDTALAQLIGSVAATKISKAA